MAAAALSCGHVPLGTIIGGWTLTVLAREPVRALFADHPSIPRDDDTLYLNLVSRFHYFVSVVNGTYCFLPIMFFAVLPLAVNNPSKNGPPAAMLWAFGIFGIAIFLYLLALCICTWLAGGYLKQRRHRMFCFVVAAVNSMGYPHGLILGAFTILVLLRPSVQLLFDSPPAAPLPILAVPE